MGDDDDCAHLGGKDAGEVPEVVYGELFEEAGAFIGGVGTGQQGVRQHEAEPAARAHDLQSQAQKKQVAVGLAALMCGAVGAKVCVLGRKIGRIGEK